MCVKPEKYTRPVLKNGVGEDKFNLFRSSWDRYMRRTDITDVITVKDQLIGACSPELYEDLQNLYGSALDAKTETELLKEMRDLAVIAENNMVNVVRLRSIPQDRDEPI